MSRKLRNLKPKKVNRGAFEEQKQREENAAQNQRALLFILPLVMLAILAVGIFFGFKFYQNTANELTPVAPSEYNDDAALYDNPVLLKSVNSASPLKESFVPEVTESCGIEISPVAALGLEKLVSDAKDNGYDLMVVEGYVSYNDQKERYESAVQEYRKKSDVSLVMAEASVKKETPPEGESEQQTGLVVYLTVKTDGKFADTTAYAWLTRHCVDYGFILRYPEKENAGGIAYSSHLFRYVGREYAYKMRALDMNFDEFIAYMAAK